MIVVSCTVPGMLISLFLVFKNNSYVLHGSVKQCNIFHRAFRSGCSGTRKAIATFQNYFFKSSFDRYSPTTGRVVSLRRAGRGRFDDVPRFRFILHFLLLLPYYARDFN